MPHSASPPATAGMGEPPAGTTTMRRSVVSVTALAMAVPTECASPPGLVVDKVSTWACAAVAPSANVAAKAALVILFIWVSSLSQN